MATLWQKIQEKLKEGSYAALTKSEEIAQVGKLKMEIAMLHRNIKNLFAELGGTVYHKVVEEKIANVIEEGEVQILLKKLEHYEKELQEKETRLEYLENDL
jgi:uncharacterized protein (UPF0335 family)